MYEADSGNYEISSGGGGQADVKIEVVREKVSANTLATVPVF
jgi:hypothetical protein